MSTPADTPDTLAVLEAYYAALAAGDRDALLALLDPEIEVRYFGPEDLLPWIGTWRGQEGFAGFLDAVGGNLEILEVETLQRIADGETVVVLGRGRWRAKATGREIAANMANVFTIRDGKVREYRVYNDTAAFAAALAP